MSKLAECKVSAFSCVGEVSEWLQADVKIRILRDNYLIW
jgi:hypothetical protein